MPPPYIGCSPVGLLFDLQGPKRRLAADTATRTLRPGNAVVFRGSGRAGANELIVDYADFPSLVTDRSDIVIGDGVPRCAAEEVEGDRVLARAMTSGAVSARKGVNVTYARPNLPAITDKDAADLAVAVEAGADFVALSFVRGAADILNLRDRLRGLGSPARTIEKIEKIEAHEHLDEILAVSDGVMVARGDYGVEAGMARVPLMQKDTIARATNVGKLVITATQMLESMIHPPEPTRAEAVDVAALIIPTATGGGPRTGAKYRSDRPIIALADDPVVCNQLMLEWGVHPITLGPADSVDALVECALLAGRDLAGLPSGARVVLTAGRRTRTPGATSLIMVREIP